MAAKIAVFLIFAAAAPCFAQPASPGAKPVRGGPAGLLFAGGAEEAARLAASDIRQATPYLLLRGGITPVVFATDSAFERKYGVRYYDFGCAGPAAALSAAYNAAVFGWLENNYGRKWQREVRKDVVGYKAWKRQRENRHTSGPAE